MNKYLYPANILLPKENFEKWSVIACDQYTSEGKYWNEVEEIVGTTPSTLHLVLPEIYLNETETRVEKINKAMQEYLDKDVFAVEDNCMVYIEREITGGAIRKGILGLLDLEDYEYESGSQTLTRATEQTVASRIPPRVAIRKDAPIEFPHILIFIDDPTDSVMQCVSVKKQELKALYNFDLMQKGGHIKGYRIESDDQDKINENLGKLVKEGLLFAVGDGNHSLATAKECYRQSGSELARYALVEIVNIHNPAIEFEPIYRVLFGVDKKDLLGYLFAQNDAANGEIEHKFTVIDKDGEEDITLTAIAKLPVGTLQAYLDDYLKDHPEVEIDYIHGTDSTRELCKADKAVGFIFDGMQKSELFDAVIMDGSLPRKTFSMGHADDKRFYLEGRKIK